MKRYFRSVIIIAASLLLAIASAAVTYTAKTYGSGYSTTAAYFLQTTPDPQEQEDRSVVGSTDGIVTMGGVIVTVVLVPILAKRKSWVPDR